MKLRNNKDVFSPPPINKHIGFKKCLLIEDTQCFCNQICLHDDSCLGCNDGKIEFCGHTLKLYCIFDPAGRAFPAAFEATQFAQKSTRQTIKITILGHEYSFKSIRGIFKNDKFYIILGQKWFEKSGARIVDFFETSTGNVENKLVLGERECILKTAVAVHEVLVTLEIPKTIKRIRARPHLGGRWRCSSAIVRNIERLDNNNNNNNNDNDKKHLFVGAKPKNCDYQRGDVVSAFTFLLKQPSLFFKQDQEIVANTLDDNVNKHFASGVYYFQTRQEAETFSISKLNFTLGKLFDRTFGG